MVRRRSLPAGLGAGLATLATPVASRAQSATTLRFTPQQALVTLCPATTTACITRHHGYMVFDILYGMDGSFQATPQMVEGHRIENDGRPCTLNLREGLLFHDGERVLTWDCVASIERRVRRDRLGATLIATIGGLATLEDSTIRFRLKRPFPLRRLAHGEAAVAVSAMMPDRLARTGPSIQATGLVGSGSFRLGADGRVAGTIEVRREFGRYVPRTDDPVGRASGPKVVHVDRIDRHVIPTA